MPAVLAALVRAAASAAASSLQGSGQFLRQLRNLLPDQNPFPFLQLLQAHQVVSQIERRQDRDAGRIGRITVLCPLAHLTVHEIGPTLKVPAVVAAAHTVYRAKDLYFRAASRHGFHVRGPPAKPSNKYRDASGLAEAGLYHSFVTPPPRPGRPGAEPGLGDTIRRRVPLLHPAPAAVPPRSGAGARTSDHGATPGPGLAGGHVALCPALPRRRPGAAPDPARPRVPEPARPGRRVRQGCRRGRRHGRAGVRLRRGGNRETTAPGRQPPPPAVPPS